MKKIDSVLDEVLKRIKPSKEELAEISDSLDKFVKNLKKSITESKVDAEIFIGGSFAKKTLIKKGEYDVDIFMRFGQKYSEQEIPNLAEKVLSKIVKFSVVHGSRDYFKIQARENLFFELVPVRKVKNSKDAENITDLSYSHVKYINKKVKSKKILEDIMVAKAFCHANQCYGAESYISGFSGYALELLIYHYKSFEKFLRAVSKIKNKEVIDIEKQFKKKKDVLLDMNGAKLNSPIILVDPTHKHRNVLAALSEETFGKFLKATKSFLKNPSISGFEVKKTDLKKIKQNAEKKKLDFALLEVQTDKPEGDVAGSKLLKFYKHLGKEIEKFFKITNQGFNYNGKHSARYFFVAKNKGEFLIEGPNIKDKKNVQGFEKMHKDYFTKKGRIYAKEILKINLEEFLAKWQIKNKDKIKEMYITEFRII